MNETDKLSPEAYSSRVAQAKLDAERDYWAEIIQERIVRYQGRFKRAERARSQARRQRRQRGQLGVDQGFA
jgi:hypothetical protein